MRTTRFRRFRRLPWLCLLLLAVGALAPPASAAPMKGMRPGQAFRALALEVKNHMQVGDYANAESGARLLYNRFGDSGNDIESSGATTLLGRILREQGKYAEAETLLRQALARRERIFGETDDRTITNRFLLAKTLIPLGKYAEADTVLKRALDAQRRSGRRGGIEELRIVNLLGLVQLQLGRHAESEALLKQALADTRDLDDKKGAHTRSGTMYILARSLNAANKFTEAEKYARESVALRERMDNPENAEVAKAQLVLGRALIGQNRLAEAETLLRRALVISEKTLGPDHNETAKIVASLAYLAGQRGQTAEAGNYLKRAADNARRANVPAQSAHSARAYARFLIKQGRAREALPYYREALDAVDRLFANTRGLDESVREGFIAQYTNYYQEMTELLLRLHGADGARGHDREALAVVSRTQSRLFTELLRQADVGRFSTEPAFLELKRKRESLQERVNLLYARRYNREADFSGREAGPGPDTFNADEETAPRQTSDRPIALAQQELAAVEERLRKEFPRFMELTQPKPVTVEALQQRLLRPGEALLTYALLKDKTAIFAVTRTNFRLTLVPQSRDQITAAIHAVRRRLEQVATTGTFASLNELDPKQLYQLYQTLVAPMEPVLKGAQRVLLVGDGPIHTLPLEMLVTRYGDKDQQTFAAARKAGEIMFSEYATLAYLGDSYRFAYLPSLAALSTQRLYPKRGAGYDRELVSFADPVFENEGGGGVGEATRGALAVLARSVRGQETISIPRLPETADEAREIAKTLGGRNEIFLRDKAQEKTAKTLNLKTTRYLHFATHGLLGGEFLQVKESAKGSENDYLLPDERTRTLAVVAASGKPEDTAAEPAQAARRGQPALVLTLVGNLKGEDGLLTMREVIEDLDLNAELVVLSACNTAGESAEAQNGEGFAGLTRGFMYAGAKGLLVSHWSVESLSAKDLMNESFRHLKAGAPAVAALREARLTVRASRDTGGRFSRAHPYFWAPFVYVGD
ncbi:MAG: CHAT domain-containing tetratricopeptide repeat protein [Pseudomonadota bacterium]